MIVIVCLKGFLKLWKNYTKLGNLEVPNDGIAHRGLASTDAVSNAFSLFFNVLLKLCVLPWFT